MSKSRSAGSYGSAFFFHFKRVDLMINILITISKKEEREERRSYCLQQTIYRLNMFFKSWPGPYQFLAKWSHNSILEIAKRNWTVQARWSSLISLDPGVSRQIYKAHFSVRCVLGKRLKNVLILLKTSLNMSLRGNSLLTQLMGF